MYWGINVFINLSAHGVFGSVLGLCLCLSVSVCHKLEFY